MEPVNFQMNPGGRVRVRVVDEQGKAIPKFHVLFQSWLGSTPVFEFDEINREADDRGVWEWREATWDPFVADIICPGHAAVRSVELVAREDEYVFQAAPALIVSGRVVDRVTKNPVSRFLVRWGFQVSPRAAYWTHAASFATADGRYRVPTAQDHLDRQYIIQIEADGYEPAVSRAIRGNAGSITLDFELTKGQNFDGTVLTPELRPAAHAKVAASAGWHPPFQRINGDVDSRSWDWRETDAAGRIHFPPQGRDFELFITHASGYANYHPTPKSNHRIIMLDPWTRVEGTYRVGGKPLAGIPIWIWHGDAGWAWSGDLRVFEWHRTTTGPRGRFVIERVIGGRGLIGRRFIWPANGGSAEISSTSRVEMGFPLGKTVHIDIEEKGRPVIGTLRPPAGIKQKLAWQSAVVELALQTNGDIPSSHFTAPVGADGSFRTDPLPGGVYSLDVRFLKGGPGHVWDYTVVVDTRDMNRNRNLTQPLDLGMLTLDKD